MTLFSIIAAAMVLVALALVVPPLLGRGRGSAETRQELNVAIFRERLAELEEDLAEGAVDEAHYSEARAELERDLLEDTTEENAAGRRRASGGRWVAVAVAIALPLMAGGFYWKLGAHHLIDGIPARAGQDRGPSVEEMVARLAERMEKNPDDPTGWVMLGRSYLVMERYDEAVQAYEKAYALVGDQPELMADYAEALSMTAGGSMAGRPLELVTQALLIDPENTKALWLAGIAAYQGGEREAAVSVWRKLAALLPPDGDNVRIVNDAIARVQGELQQGSVTPSVAAVGAGQVVVEVELAEALRAQAAPDDTVFVFARPVQGPPMPLAAVRLQVKDLPATVTLDDSQAMMAERKLSTQQQVTVSARVSKSGNAVAQAGDLQGSVANVSVAGGSPVKVTIDRRVQ